MSPALVGFSFWGLPLPYVEPAKPRRNVERWLAAVSTSNFCLSNEAKVESSTSISLSRTKSPTRQTTTWSRIPLFGEKQYKYISRQTNTVSRTRSPTRQITTWSRIPSLWGTCDFLPQKVSTTVPAYYYTCTPDNPAMFRRRKHHSNAVDSRSLARDTILCVYRVYQSFFSATCFLPRRGRLAMTTCWRKPPRFHRPLRPLRPSVYHSKASARSPTSTRTRATSRAVSLELRVRFSGVKLLPSYLIQQLCPIVRSKSVWRPQRASVWWATETN